MLVFLLITGYISIFFSLASSYLKNHNNFNNIVKARHLRIFATTADPKSVNYGSQNAKQAWTPTTEPKTARERASFRSKIPFSEKMYEVLKTSIELLTERINTKKALTIDEAAWLQNAVEIIVEDANLYGPPERPKKDE